MKMRDLILVSTATLLLAGCTAAENTAAQAADAAKAAASTTVAATAAKAGDAMAAAKSALPGVDISTAPAGVYVSEKSHAYITFQYLHQGYARPTLRWNDFEARIELDSDNPENSVLTVDINAASIDSGVEKFDEHLVSADFFDVANHPVITFTSTALKQSLTGSGTVTGDLTMKGISKPVTLDVTLNKVGENFRSKKPMLGISAKTQIKRSEWDLGKYTPLVGDEVDIIIEVEFIQPE